VHRRVSLAARRRGDELRCKIGNLTGEARLVREEKLAEGTHLVLLDMMVGRGMLYPWMSKMLTHSLNAPVRRHVGGGLGSAQVLWVPGLHGASRHSWKGAQILSWAW